MASSGPQPRPAPRTETASHDRDRAWLRREVVKQVFPLVTLAAVSTLVPLSLIALMLVVRPAEMANAVGLGKQQIVTVTAASVDDRAGKASARERSGPLWTLGVSWVADGVHHRATDSFRSHETFIVGQTTAAVRIGDRVSVRPSSPGTTLLGVGALLGVVAIGNLFYLRRARLWFSVFKVAPSGPRERAVVTGSPRRHEERPTRFRPAELGHLVPMDLFDQLGRDLQNAPRRLFVLRARHRWMLRMGDEVEVWTTGRISAIRRVADGYWWLTAVDSERFRSVPGLHA